MRREGFGFAIKIKCQGFVNASDMRFSTYSDRELFRGIAISIVDEGESRRGEREAGLGNADTRDLWEPAVQPPP